MRRGRECVFVSVCLPIMQKGQADEKKRVCLKGVDRKSSPCPKTLMAACFLFVQVISGRDIVRVCMCVSFSRDSRRFSHVFSFF